jgi:hypothetical protein
MHRIRLALLELLLVAFLAPSAALAGNSQVKLALLPVGQPGSYFDLTMMPGHTRRLEVDFANDGGGALAARTYAADVYTIINGGFGARLRDTPQSGMTTWVDYATDVVALPAGKSIRRAFTVTVPADALPGEYIMSLVLENEMPFVNDGAVNLHQIVRQAVAVVVTLPGARTPGLAIGLATHKVVAGTSVVSIAVENTGNLRLKPAVGFTLFDAAGGKISQPTVQMDTFYAHTDTFVEMPLASLLSPGTYAVRLTLDDSSEGARAEDDRIALVVEAPTESVAGEGTVPGLIDVIQNTGAGQTTLAVWGAAIFAGLVLALFSAWRIGILRRRRLTWTSDHPPTG